MKISSKRIRWSSLSILILLIIALSTFLSLTVLNKTTLFRSKAASSCNQGVYDVSYNPLNQICTITASDSDRIGCYYRDTPDDIPLPCELDVKSSNPIVVDGTTYTDYSCKNIVYKIKDGGEVGALRYDACRVELPYSNTSTYLWHEGVWKTVRGLEQSSHARILDIVQQIDSVCKDDKSGRNGVVTKDNYSCVQKIVGTLNTTAFKEVEQSTHDSDYFQCVAAVRTFTAETSEPITKRGDAYLWATDEFLPGYKYHDISEGLSGKAEIKPNDLIIWKSKGKYKVCATNGCETVMDPGHIAYVVSVNTSANNRVHDFDIAEANSTVQGGYHGYVRTRTISYDYSPWLAGWQEKL